MSPGFIILFFVFPVCLVAFAWIKYFTEKGSEE